jgi:hypothetical protein
MPAVPTPRPARPAFRRHLAWSAIVAAALAFLFLVDRQRLQRLHYVSGNPTWSVDAPVADAASPTGYAEGRRRLIVPGHHTPSYFWISQTQRALAGVAVPPHHVDSDNFPAGRESVETSPYRCWLMSLARLDHLLSGRSLPLAVEHASLYADPLLQALLVAGVAVFAAVHFGGLVAAAAALTVVALFPFAGSFQPGAPDHHALAWVLLVAGGLLVLVAATRDRARLWIALGGAAGALGLWTDPLSGEPLVLGLALGGALGGWFLRDGAPPLPWRAWGWAGALVLFAGWLLEFGPTRWDPAVASLHPLHGLAWLGLGELLHQASVWPRGGKKFPAARGLVLTLLALGAVVALPTVRLLAENGRFLADHPLATELVNLPNGVRASSTGAWLRRDGAGGVFLATVLPLLFVALGVRLAFARAVPLAARRALVLALGPVLVALIPAWQQLSWWNGFGAAFIVLLVATAAAAEASPGAAGHWRWRGLAVVVFLPGFFLLPQPAGSRGEDPLAEHEVLALVERDLAHWLVHQHGREPTVVFTTPGLTEALAYYGNLKGIASYDPANDAGWAAAVRIASSGTATESTALLESRQVTHLLLPSWDPTLQRLAQQGRHLPPDAPVPADSLVAKLEGWYIPPWLRLMPYHTPSDMGSGSYFVQVLAVQPETDDILTACRKADYLVEMGLADQARACRDELKLHPRSLPALASLAQVNQALGDRAGHDEALQTLLPYVSRRAGRTLTLDRRISLAALLIQAKQTDATRDQMQQCLAGLNADNLRELTTGEIVRLFAIADLLKMPVDPKLRQLGLSLVPPTLRARLDKSAAR